jgi:hypothetical protein
MNMKQLLLSGAALASAVLFSSCTVDGYGYSGSYDTHYSSSYGGGYYDGAGYYGGGLIAPRYYSSHHHHYIPRGGSYCPPPRGHGSHGHGSHSGGHSSHGGGRPHDSHATVPRSSRGGGFSAYAEAARESRSHERETSRPVVERPAPREMPSAPRESSSSGGGRGSDWSGGGRPTFQEAVRRMKD